MNRTVAYTAFTAAYVTLFFVALGWLVVSQFETERETANLGERVQVVERTVECTDDKACREFIRRAIDSETGFSLQQACRVTRKAGLGCPEMKRRQAERRRKERQAERRRQRREALRRAESLLEQIAPSAPAPAPTPIPSPSPTFPSSGGTSGGSSSGGGGGGGGVNHPGNSSPDLKPKVCGNAPSNPHC